MGSFKLIDEENNIWIGSLADFNANVANNFYSYGVPDGYTALTQGGGGKAATVIFPADEFFKKVVDADKGIDFDKLSPDKFSFVQTFFAGKSGLAYGTYSAAQLRDAKVGGLSINGTLYDWGSNFGSKKLPSEVGFTIGSYSVRIADDTKFHLSPAGVSISNFGYYVAEDNYDFRSSNVSGVVNGTASVINAITKPFGIYEPVKMVFEGARYQGLVNQGNYQTAYGDWCFPSFTSIMMDSGECKPISDISEGDTVLAFDPSADLGRGGLVPCKVTRLYRNTTTEWIKLTWQENGQAQVLVATPGHHFLNVFGEFPPIEDMIENGKATVVLASGATVEVAAERIVYSLDTAHMFERAKTQLISVDNAALAPTMEDCWQTYNFEVEELHTYVASGVRVHNKSTESDHTVSRQDADILRDMFTADQVTLIEKDDGKFLYFLDKNIEIVQLDGTRVKLGDYVPMTLEGAAAVREALSDALESIPGYLMNYAPQIISDLVRGGDLEKVAESYAIQLAINLGVDFLADTFGLTGDKIGFTKVGDLPVINSAKFFDTSAGQAVKGAVIQFAVVAALRGSEMNGSDWAKLAANTSIRYAVTEVVKQFEWVASSVPVAMIADKGTILLTPKLTPAGGAAVAAAVTFFSNLVDHGFKDFDKTLVQTAVAAATTYIGQTLGAALLPVLGPLGPILGGILGGLFGSLFGGRKLPPPPPLVKIEYHADGTLTQYVTAQSSGYGVSARDGQNDKLIGNHGPDTLVGSNGDNELYGNGGNDILHGKDGNDVLIGGDGNDYVLGGNGDDRISGGEGDDTLYGDQEWDGKTAYASNGPGGKDTVTGGAGNDYIHAGGNTDFVDGGEGDDKLNGGDGADVVIGGSGNDVVSGDTGDDTLFGDMVVIDPAGNMTFSGAGDDRIYAGLGNDTVYAGGGNDIVTGNDGNDVISGMDGNDTVWGENGDDSLFGGAGDDILYGQTGNDTLEGGEGNDILEGGDGRDSLDGGMGNDTVNGGNGNDILNGNLGNDKISGGTGDDLLLGGVGDDVLAGGEHNDRLLGEIGNDILKGDAGDDTLSGGAGDDVLHGGEGNDILEGGTENDALNGDAGNDVLNGGNGEDVLVGGFGDDTLSGGAGNDELLAGGGNDTLNGGDGADTLDGEEGNDVLSGGLGDDRLIGGVGTDSLSGGTGNDIYEVDLFGGSVTISETEGTDVLKLTGGVEPKHVSLTRDGDDLVIYSVRDNANAVRIQGQFADGARKVEAVQFSNAYTINLTNLIIGDDGDNNLVGTEGNDGILGLGGNDSILGLGGDDFLDGGAGKDGIFGGGGNDTIHGSGENDLLVGDDGNDVIIGGTGDDVLVGGQGKDLFVINIEAGKETISDFEKGDDRIDLTGFENRFVSLKQMKYFGSGIEQAGTDSVMKLGSGQLVLIEDVDASTLAENDFLFNIKKVEGFSGTGGNDIIDGTAGNDVIVDGSGFDIMTGGAGSDVFKVTARSGDIDTITDFNSAEDRIDLSAFGDRISVAQLSFTQKGDDTIVELGNNQHLLLERVQANSLKDENFYFDVFVDRTMEAQRFSGHVDHDFSRDDNPEGEADSSVFAQVHRNADIPKGSSGAGIWHHDPSFDSFDNIFKTGPNAVFHNNEEWVRTGGKKKQNVLVKDYDFRVEEFLLYSGFYDLPSDELSLSNDEMHGNWWSERIWSFGGNDAVYAGAGDDQIWAGTGNDYVNGMDGNDAIYGEDGFDHLVGGSQDDWIHGGGHSDRLYGEDGNDFLNGGWGEDLIDGGNGDDQLHGEEGFDILRGGSGHDALHGGGHSDSLYGDDDNDQLNGGWGEDFLDGGNGHDVLNGEDGYDILRGGAHNDWMNGGGHNDTLYGDDGDDTLIGDWGEDRLIGGTGHDALHGGAGSDDLEGNEGNDRLYGGTGTDVLRGGSGWDYIVGEDDSDLIYGIAGNHWIHGGVGADVIYGGTGDEIIYGGSGSDLIEGGDGSDLIFGGVNNDVVKGGIGNDRLFGGAGNDRVSGDSGEDYIDGGTGDDTLHGNEGKDRLIGDLGNDTLDGGDQNDQLLGGQGRDHLIGGHGSDLLEGGADDDVLIGGAGADVLVGGQGADLFRFSFRTDSQRAMIDVITDFERNIDKLDFRELEISFENLVIVESANHTDISLDREGDFSIRLLGAGHKLDQSHFLL
ncbi:M10 family metallopeptidase C-terminal domain-containing protein [Agrobacterium sp. NPDC089420]|uniref:M10 family metallopeptidase C-terminal domain-containing protein n=1 Tax=Agrobacterium sp. NPDC089420 TaxID=3363918 RepID=UPI00384B0E90